MDEATNTKRQIEKLPPNVRDQDVSVGTNFKQAIRAYHRRLRNMNTADLEWIEKPLGPIQSPTTTLKQAIDDYLQWMTSSAYAHNTYKKHRNELNKFLHFVTQRQMDWDDIFTFDTLKDFQKGTQIAAAHAVRRLSRYLFEQKTIQQPIHKPYRRLPDLYEDYLGYYNSD